MSKSAQVFSITASAATSVQLVGVCLGNGPSGTAMMPTRKLLVLDLDETLMFASMFRLPTRPEFRLGLAQAVRRPGLNVFLERCFSLFRVAIWTSATTEYAAEALVQLLPANADLAFVWTRQQCYRETDPVRGDNYWIKDARFLAARGYAMDSLLVLDDEPRSWASYRDRVLPVPKFRGEPKDTALSSLLPVLSQAATAPDLTALVRHYAATLPDQPS
jgi:TFIIF-interacting CTD phosphatase-like protein